MRRMSGARRWAVVLMGAVVLAAAPGMAAKKSDCPYKVYVILGFHTNFYHSWRGDTNDEAGFGTDIRIVRELLRMLDEADAQGLDVRGYWEGESLFTFEDIIPKNAPDIIDGIRRRIDAGRDEFMLAPYSNTLFGAATPDEMRATVQWSISNPWGSGAKDLFGSYVPLIRTQEGMGTTGMIPLLLEEGIEGVVFAYSSYSFTTFSNFVPPLPPEQRFHITTLRMRESDPAMLLFPCVSAADFVNYISCERWLLDLRKLQTSGQVNQDLVIHVNFDADAETWLPLVPGLDWVPNAGGLMEYVRAVTKYDWAEFTLPSIYIKEHQPVGEVLVRQDLADGGWDGNYSWAEKHPSHAIWTELEKSRLATRRAEDLLRLAAAGPVAAQARALLYDGRESSFFERVRGLSTTHFGMSTPLVNEERQAVAEAVVARAKGQAEKALRLAADAVAAKAEQAGPEVLYSFLVQGSTAGNGHNGPVFNLLRIPVILPEPIPPTDLADERGAKLAFSLVNIESLGNGAAAAELMVPLELKPDDTRRLTLKTIRAITTPPPGAVEQPVILDRLANDQVELALDPEAGIGSLRAGGRELAGSRALTPFITYGKGKKAKTYYADRYEREALPGESWDGARRARIRTSIKFPASGGDAEARLTVTFTLPDAAGFAVADVEIAYPYTDKHDLLVNMQQHLRRYLDLAWIEVAPFEFHPALDATRDEPIRVWKRNYLGVTSWYELNYGQINEKNAQLDSFNHQITAGWVAVTDRKQGLLVGQSADVFTSFAFCPMRLREDNRAQRLALNPFGSYYGTQMDYRHLGGNGLGQAIAETASSALRPNGPSYNGVTERFSLLLAPYEGDEPPARLQAEAAAFFYPPVVVYERAPEGVDARLREDVWRIAAETRRDRAREATGPLPSPLAFLVNPTESAADLVWDEPGDERIDGYEIEWKEKDAGDWTTAAIGKTRRHRVEGLTNGAAYSFRMRAAGMGQESPWSEELDAVIGPVKPKGILSNASGVKFSTILKTLHYINVHLLTTP